LGQPTPRIARDFCAPASASPRRRPTRKNRNQYTPRPAHAGGNKTAGKEVLKERTPDRRKHPFSGVQSQFSGNDKVDSVVYISPIMGGIVRPIIDRNACCAAAIRTAHNMAPPEKGTRRECEESRFFLENA